ncbi:nol1 nop2 sun family protein [Cystoisospora suis]|uniref:Nol1 nop2 sun family protein n=1 Tax=Cystoisospora suis TaxID=483139 RepID=A0A2C6KJK0_9APIC|nr:nol1 nop2 sun family protein [Cystoisospora suis]
MATIYREAGRILDMMETRGCGLRAALYQGGGGDRHNPLLPKICALVCRTIERKADLEALLASSGLCGASSPQDTVEERVSSASSLKRMKDRNFQRQSEEEEGEPESQDCLSLKVGSQDKGNSNNQGRPAAKGILLVMTYDLVYGRGRIIGGGRCKRLLLSHIRLPDKRLLAGRERYGSEGSRGECQEESRMKSRLNDHERSYGSKEKEEGREGMVKRKNDEAYPDSPAICEMVFPRYLRVSLSRRSVSSVLTELNAYLLSSCSSSSTFPPSSTPSSLDSSLHDGDPSSLSHQPAPPLSQPASHHSLSLSACSSGTVETSHHVSRFLSCSPKPLSSSLPLLPSSDSAPIISRDPLLPSCGLRAPPKASQLLLNHPLVKEGIVALQDRASSLAALSADIQPGDFVLDACASPGSKTLHILDLLHGHGHLIALERDLDRAVVLIRRLLLQGNLDGPFLASACSPASRLSSPLGAPGPAAPSTDSPSHQEMKNVDRLKESLDQKRNNEKVHRGDDDVFRTYARKASQQPLYFTSRGHIPGKTPQSSPSLNSSCSPSYAQGPSSSRPTLGCPCLALRGRGSPSPVSDPSCGHPLLLVEVRVTDFLRISGFDPPFCYVEKLVLDPSCSGSGLPLHRLSAHGDSKHSSRLVSVSSASTQEDNKLNSRKGSRVHSEGLLPLQGSHRTDQNTVRDIPSSVSDDDKVSAHPSQKLAGNLVLHRHKGRETGEAGPVADSSQTQSGSETSGEARRTQRGQFQLEGGSVPRGETLSMGIGNVAEDSGFHATPSLSVMSRLSPEKSSLRRVQQLGAFQRRLLAHALTNFPSVRVCCYSTCSSYVEENEGVVAYALEEITRAHDNAGRCCSNQALCDDKKGLTDRPETTRGTPTSGKRNITHFEAHEKPTCVKEEKENETEEVKVKEGLGANSEEKDCQGCSDVTEARGESQTEEDEHDMCSEWEVIRGQQVDSRWFPSEEGLACLQAKLLEEQERGKISTRDMDAACKRSANDDFDMLKTRGRKKGDGSRDRETEILFERWSRVLSRYGPACVRSSPATHSCRGFFLARLERKMPQKPREHTGRGEPPQTETPGCAAVRQKRSRLTILEPSRACPGGSGSLVDSLAFGEKQSSINRNSKCRSTGEAWHAGHAWHPNGARDCGLSENSDICVCLPKGKKKRKKGQFVMEAGHDPASSQGQCMNPVPAEQKACKPAHTYIETAGNASAKWGTDITRSSPGQSASKGNVSKKTKVQPAKQIPGSDVHHQDEVASLDGAACKRMKKLRSRAPSRCSKRGIVVA